MYLFNGVVKVSPLESKQNVSENIFTHGHDGTACNKPPHSSTFVRNNAFDR